MLLLKWLRNTTHSIYIKFYIYFIIRQIITDYIKSVLFLNYNKIIIMMNVVTTFKRNREK